MPDTRLNLKPRQSQPPAAGAGAGAGAGAVQIQAGQLWQSVLTDLQTELTKTAFDNWLRHTTLVGFGDDVATVGVANTFSAWTLEARYAPQIERALSRVIGRSIRVEFTVDTSDADADGLDAHADEAGDEPAPIFAPPDHSSSLPATTHSIGLGRATGVKSSRPRHTPPSGGRRGGTAKPLASHQLELTPAAASGLNPRYVYKNYVVGSSNRLAHAASLSVAEHPGGKFNPFFVYGGVGLGKTHLLHAIGHRALELNPDLIVVYVSSETFTNDLINAIRTQGQEDFRNRYRSIDLLMIDDVQFIAGKESTQEEFFHTFNALYQNGKQVILSSDKPPKAIAALEDRLRSRFEGGLIVDVQYPDYEMRTAILRSKGEEMGIAIPNDVIEYIAQKDQSNIRELEGALNKILVFAQITEQPLTLPLAMEALTDATISSRRANITPNDVVSAVARHFDVSFKELRSSSRTKEIVVPRQVAMYLLREETSSSLVEIGHELGGRDHTTIMHGIKKIERSLETDSALRSQLMAIRELLYTAK